MFNGYIVNTLKYIYAIALFVVCFGIFGSASVVLAASGVSPALVSTDTENITLTIDNTGGGTELLARLHKPDGNQWNDFLCSTGSECDFNFALSDYNDGWFVGDVPTEGTWTVLLIQVDVYVPDSWEECLVGKGAGGRPFLTQSGCEESFNYILGTVEFEYTTASAFELLLSAVDGNYTEKIGFAIGEPVGFMEDNFIKVFIGSGLAILYSLRFWIVSLWVLAIIIYFAFRAFRFFRA